MSSASSATATAAASATTPDDDTCIICMQPAVAPTRLSCDCKFSCCQGCILSWVRTARNAADEERERAKKMQEGAMGSDDPLAKHRDGNHRQSPNEHSETTTTAADDNTPNCCPICRRSDVHMVVKDTNADLSAELNMKGFTNIAIFEQGEVPKPPVKGGIYLLTGEEYAEQQELDRLEREAGVEDSSTDIAPAEGTTLTAEEEAAVLAAKDEVAYEKQYQRYLKVHAARERKFKAPLYEAIKCFTDGILANPKDPQGYIGTAYLSLLISDYTLASRYLLHVIDHIDAEQPDAVKLLHFVESKLAEQQEQQQKDSE